MSHAPANTTPVKKANLSPAWIAIGVSLFLFILLIVGTILWVQDKSTPTPPPAENDATWFDHSMLNYAYGDVLQLEIKPGTEVTIKLSNDYYCYWSSAQIKTRDSKHLVRTLEGSRFVEGDVTSTDVQWRRFKNTNKNSITVKVKRCNSFEECNF